MILADGKKGEFLITGKAVDILTELSIIVEKIYKSPVEEGAISEKVMKDIIMHSVEAAFKSKEEMEKETKEMEKEIEKIERAKRIETMLRDIFGEDKE